MMCRFCGDNAVVTKDGLSRLFAGEVVKSSEAQDSFVVNDQAYVNLPQDNLATFPSKVVFAGKSKDVSAEEAEKMLGEVCGGEEGAKFVAELLKVKVRMVCDV
jgi:hypothetical protein